MRLLHFLVALAMLQAATITVLGIEVHRDEQRIEVLSRELSNVPEISELKAVK
jgi:hypothetical protein